MWIQGKVRNCDFNDISYSEPVTGAWALCRGASGRVCCVMWAGPEYIEETGIRIATREEAEKWALSEPGGSIDF